MKYYLVSVLVVAITYANINKPPQPAFNANIKTTSSSLKTLIPYFSADSSQLAKGQTAIPLKVIAPYFSSIDTNWFSVAHSRWLYKNKYGTFLILQLDCNAGGYCDMLYMLHFDLGGRYIDKIEIGNEAGEMTKWNVITWELEDSGMLVTQNIHYLLTEEENELPVDTVRQKYLLK